SAGASRAVRNTSASSGLRVRSSRPSARPSPSGSMTSRRAASGRVCSVRASASRTVPAVITSKRWYRRAMASTSVMLSSSSTTSTVPSAVVMPPVSARPAAHGPCGALEFLESRGRVVSPRAASADAACQDLGDPSSDEGVSNVAALARWCYRHRLVVLLLWVGALCGLAVSARSAGTNYASVFSLPDTDSKRAYDLLEKAFPERAGDTDSVVWKVDEGSVRDDAVRSRIEPALRE